MRYAFLRQLTNAIPAPTGARDEFHLAAIAQNLRKLAKLLPMPTENPEPV